MGTKEVLIRLLQITEENNRILKELQENGIAITMPNFDELNSQDDEPVPVITKDVKPKI